MKHEPMKNDLSEFRLTSAGGVVYQVKWDQVEVVLCGRGYPRVWTLPKGTPERTETIEETALREVREETGLHVEIEEPVGSIYYEFDGKDDGKRYRKTVRFFLMEPKGGNTGEHDCEFDEVRWFPIIEALRVIKYPNEALIIEQAMSRINLKEINN